MAHLQEFDWLMRPAYLVLGILSMAAGSQFGRVAFREQQLEFHALVGMGLVRCLEVSGL